MACWPLFADPAISISGSNPMSFARFSRVSSMSSTIRMRILSVMEASAAYLCLTSDYSPAREIRGEGDQSARAKSDAVRDPRLQHLAERVRLLARSGTREPAQHDDDERDKASEHHAVERPHEQELCAAQRTDRHEQLHIARFQSARHVERIQEREAEHHGREVIEEPGREDRAEAAERGEDQAEHDRRVRDDVRYPVRAEVRDHHGHEEPDEEHVLRKT